MIRRVILIRHGQTEGNRLGRYIGVTDEPLSPEGIRALAGRRLEETDVLVLSPMLRALQSAAVLTGAASPGTISQMTKADRLLERIRAALPDTAVLTEPDFRECDFGLFENRNYLEMADLPAYQEWVDSGGTLPFPGGEDPACFRRRTQEAFLRLLCEREDDERMTVIAHGGTIMSIMEAFSQDPAGRRRSYYDWHVRNAEGYTLERIGEGKSVLLRVCSKEGAE